MIIESSCTKWEKTDCIFFSVIWPIHVTQIECFCDVTCVGIELLTLLSPRTLLGTWMYQQSSFAIIKCFLLSFSFAFWIGIHWNSVTSKKMQSIASWSAISNQLTTFLSLCFAGKLSEKSTSLTSLPTFIALHADISGKGLHSTKHLGTFPLSSRRFDLENGWMCALPSSSRRYYNQQGTTWFMVIHSTTLSSKFL